MAWQVCAEAGKAEGRAADAAGVIKSAQVAQSVRSGPEPQYGEYVLVWISGGVPGAGPENEVDPESGAHKRAFGRRPWLCAPHN